MRKAKEMKAAERKKFTRLVREYLASLGAVRADVVSLHARCDSDRFLLATRGGTLEVNLMSLDEATVFCKFSHPELAALVLRSDEFNPYSGKHNFHLGYCETAEYALNVLRSGLARIVVPGNAAEAKVMNDHAAARFEVHNTLGIPDTRFIDGRIFQEKLGIFTEPTPLHDAADAVE